MPLRQPLKPEDMHPLSKAVRKKIAFNAPIPGSSLTKQLGSMPYEKPPQFTKLTELMHYFMDQLTEPYYLKQLLQQMEAGVSIEAITRTLLFTGFTYGKFTVDLAMLAYKPLMLTLLAIAHRAGLKDTPVVVPIGLANHRMNKLKNHMNATSYKTLRDKATKPVEIPTAAPEVPTTAAKGGFMSKPSNVMGYP